MDDVVDEISDPGVARAKLAWWRREVEQTFAGQPTHTVAIALPGFVAQFNLTEAHLQEVIDGMAINLAQQRYLDFAALELYLP